MSLAREIDERMKAALRAKDAASLLKTSINFAVALAAICHLPGRTPGPVIPDSFPFRRLPHSRFESVRRVWIIPLANAPRRPAACLPGRSAAPRPRILPSPTPARLARPVRSPPCGRKFHHPCGGSWCRTGDTHGGNTGMARGGARLGVLCLRCGGPPPAADHRA